MRASAGVLDARAEAARERAPRCQAKFYGASGVTPHLLDTNRCTFFERSPVRVREGRPVADDSVFDGAGWSSF